MPIIIERRRIIRKETGAENLHNNGAAKMGAKLTREPWNDYLDRKGIYRKSRKKQGE